MTHCTLGKRVNDHAARFVLRGQGSRAQEHFRLSPLNTPRTIASMTVTWEDPTALWRKVPNVVYLLALPKECYHYQAKETEGSWLNAAKTSFQNPTWGVPDARRTQCFTRARSPLTNTTTTPALWPEARFIPLSLGRQKGYCLSLQDERNGGRPP